MLFVALPRKHYIKLGLTLITFVYIYYVHLIYAVYINFYAVVKVQIQSQALKTE